MFAALLALALALSLAGLVTTTAQAAPTASVTGRVLDAGGDPIRGVWVFGFASGKGADGFLATTNSQGYFKMAQDQRLSPGRYDVILDGGEEYVAASFGTTLVAGPNTLPTRTLELGGHAHGVVTAPSGQPLKNISAYLDNPDADGEDPVGATYSTSDAAGRLEFGPLAPGTYGIYSGFEVEDNEPTTSLVIGGPEDDEQFTLKDVRVLPKITLKSSTGSKGRATVRINVSASRFGIGVAGGTFDLYDGSKRIKKAYRLSNDKRTLNLVGLKKGAHTFQVRYRGGVDTIAARSAKSKVKVT